MTPRATGKPSIEVPTAELPGLVTSGSSTVEYIVFLNRRDGDSPGLVPRSQESVLPWFKQFLLMSTEFRTTQENALKRLLKAKVFELHYTKLDWAVERLQQLALTGK